MAEGSQPQAAQVQAGKDEELRRQLTEILGEILTRAQELGFELATLDYGEINRCPHVRPLIEKARELIVSLKKLFAMRKAFA